MKRRYSKNLPFVESGFRACWANANELQMAARILIEAEKFGVALSISVLSMEEIGKMMFLDGLLLSVADDYKEQAFKSGFRRHQSKLAFLDLFPFFYNNLAMVDPRYRIPEFKQAIAISIMALKNERAALSTFLGDACDLSDLDVWKQKGFYSSENNGKISPPIKIVPREFAEAVRTVAWRYATCVDFVLRDGNIDRYFENANSLRSKIDEDTWKRLSCGPRG